MSIRSRQFPTLAGLLLVLAAPAALSAQATAPAQVSPAQFAKLKWLAGAWQGSGGAYPAFFEEYRIIDDSTIGMRSFSSADLSKVNDSARIEFRNGNVYHRGHGSEKVAIELTGSTVHFAPVGAARGGFIFNRHSADLWTATLQSAKEGGHETIYVMRRVRQ